MYMGTRNNNNGRSSMEAVVDGKSGYNTVTGGSGQLGPVVDGDGSRVGGNVDVMLDGGSGNDKPNDKSYSSPSVSRVVDDSGKDADAQWLEWMQSGIRGNGPKTKQQLNTNNITKVVGSGVVEAVGCKSEESITNNNGTATVSLLNTHTHTTPIVAYAVTGSVADIQDPSGSRSSNKLSSSVVGRAHVAPMCMQATPLARVSPSSLPAESPNTTTSPSPAVDRLSSPERPQ